MKTNLNIISAACTLLATTLLGDARADFEQPLSSADAAANSSADLAKTLANPIGALISVPFQNNSQPFVSYTTKTSTTFTLNTESTYDWTNEQWTLPLNFMVQQIVKIGDQPIALTLGGRYYAEKPDDGPEWGLRFAVIFLFPRS